MKVLFICSGNSKFHSNIPAFIESQAQSLNKIGIEIEFFLMKGQGIKGYLKNIIPLKQFLKKNSFDLIHAHYGLTGIIASLANLRKYPMIVSFMGEAELTTKSKDTTHDFQMLSWIWPILNNWNARFVCDAVIVKSSRMALFLNDIKRLFIIPNGVDLERFHPENVPLPNLNRKAQILWIGNKTRPVKGYVIAQKVFEQLDKNKFEIIEINGVNNAELQYYYNSASLFLFTSLSEGSPNVIKEAMACNTPIVSTPVGDVTTLFEGVDGCCCSNSFDEKEIYILVNKVINNYSKSNGRTKLIEMGLGLEETAVKIKKVYEAVIEKTKKS